MQEDEVIVLIDAQVSAGGDVPDSHGMEPVDVAAWPLGAGELQAPEGPSLGGHGATFIYDDAAGAGREGEKEMLGFAV